MIPAATALAIISGFAPLLFRMIFLLPAMIVLFALLLAGTIAGAIKIKDVLYGGYAARTYTNTNSPLLLNTLQPIHACGYIPDKATASDPIYQVFAK